MQRRTPYNNDVGSASHHAGLPKPLSKHPEGAEKRRVIFISIAALLLVLSAIWYGFSYYQRRQFLSRVPEGLQQEYSFPIYYPSKLPDGYSFQQGSDRVEGPLVFYNLSDGDKHIIVGEQKPPEDSTNLTFPNSSHVDTPNGQATIGTSTVGTLVFLKTKTTLINISGSKNISPDTLTEIVRDMRSVPQ